MLFAATASLKRFEIASKCPFLPNRGFRLKVLTLETAQAFRPVNFFRLR
jgi:hypothetical protein